jgi:hypothetical protein
VYPLSRRATAGIALIAILSSTGCYTYLPSSVAAAPATEAIRVYLTAAGSELLGHQVGAEPALPATIDGVIVGRADSAFAMSVQGITRQGRDREQWRGEQVTIPLTAVDHVATRELDRGKSAIATGAAIAAAFIVRALFAGGGDSQGGGQTGGPPTGQ